MIFLHPEFIYYMMPPLILFFALIITQADRNIAIFSPEILKRLRVSQKHLSMRMRNVLYFAVFVLLILALAQPVIPHGKIHVSQKNANIVLALDTSSSMLAQDVAPNRLAMAKYKMMGFLKLLHGNKLGCIAFAKHSFLVAPLSYDHDAVGYLVKHFDPNLIVENGINFGQLLYSVNRMSKNKNSVKYLVIFTDGGDQKSFKDEIAYAKKHHIVVFVLAVGSSRGAPIPAQNGFLTYHGHIVLSKLNSNIISLTSQTGGVYIHYVLSNADINRMAKELNDTIQQNRMKVKSVPDNQPLFYIPLILAVLLLIIAMSSVPNAKKTLQLTAVMFIALLFHTTTAHADVLSFQILNDAKQAYSKHQYAKSAQLFKEYQNIHDTSDVNYDYANALYKSGQYKKAVAQYRRASFKNKTKQANLLYNTANAYAKQGTIPSLKKALKLYNQSLKLKKSNDAIYNKKVVEQLLKQKQKQKHNQKQNKQNKQQNKQNQNHKQNNQQNKQNNQQNKQNKQKHSQNKKNQNNSSKNNQSKSSKTKTQQARKPQSLKFKPSKQNNRQQKQSQAKMSQAKKQIKKKQTNQKQANKLSIKQMQKKSSSKQSNKESLKPKQKSSLQHYKKMRKSLNQQQYKNKMSKKEIKQWLKQIQFNAPTHVYEMKQIPKNMEDYDAKPW